jgi:hypothetical protein
MELRKAYVSGGGRGVGRITRMCVRWSMSRYLLYIQLFHAFVACGWFARSRYTPACDPGEVDQDKEI